MTQTTTTTSIAPEWFAVNPKGLKAQQQNQGLGPAVRELVQNAFDANGSTKVSLLITRTKTDELIISCHDNGAGFEKIEDAWTLFNPSTKKDNPELRGRFCVGEKFAVAQAKCASVKTRSGVVRFHIDGTREVRRRRNRELWDGTYVSLELGKVTKKAEREALDAARMIQAPDGVEYDVNGDPVSAWSVKATISATLATVVPDEDGALARRNRKTTIQVVETPDGMSSQLFELGLPVCTIPDPVSYDVAQRIPQTLERSQPSDGYLRTLRAHCIAELLPLMTERDDLHAAWFLDALGSPRTPLEHVKTWAKATWGDRAITYDSEDKEAMMSATEHGVEVVHPSKVPNEIRSALRELRQSDPDFMPRAGKSSFSEQDRGDGGFTFGLLYSDDELTDWQKSAVAYAFKFAELANIPLAKVQWYETEHSDGKLGTWHRLTNSMRLNATRGHLERSNFAQVLSTIIHELAHYTTSNHLSRQFSNEIARISGLALETMTSPPEFRGSQNPS